MSTWRISDSQIERFQIDLFEYFRRRVATQDARDLAADTLLAAGAQFEHRSSLRTYIFAIARNKVADHYRAMRARAAVVSLTESDGESDIAEEGPSMDSLLMMSTRHEATQRALEHVDPIFIDVVRLWLLGRDSVQIAGELGINYNTARSRLMRGKAELARALRAELGI